MKTINLQVKKPTPPRCRSTTLFDSNRKHDEVSVWMAEADAVALVADDGINSVAVSMPPPLETKGTRRFGVP